MREGRVASFADLQQRLNRKSVDARLMAAYPAETRVCPGHMGETTLGRERVGNPFLHDLAPR